MRMRDDKDRSSKWLIEHHGDSILHLGGVQGFRAWRAAQTDLVQPRQVPDGLLEAFFPGRDAPDPFLVEIATYPDRRVEDQVLRVALVVMLDRRVLPEVITLVLHPHGAFRLSGAQRQVSRHGTAEIAFQWRVVELWTLSAVDLLAANDVGLIPWLPLTRFDGPPEVLLQQCRDRIDQRAPPEEHANLLAVTQVMTRLRYNDQQLLSILGGSRIMIESPLIQELMAQTRQETMQRVIVKALESRFGLVPPELGVELRTVLDEQRLFDLLGFAFVCADADAFRARLSEVIGS
jgi:hypothetical protein